MVPSLVIWPMRITGMPLDLAHAAGRGFYLLAVHGLHRVHDHEVRSHFFGFGQNGAHVGFAENEAVVAGSAQAVGPHLHLLHAFLARHVEGFEGRRMQGQLQRKGTFADTGLSAHEHQRALHHAASQQPVHLGAAQGNAVFRCGGHVLQPHGLLRPARGRSDGRRLGAARHHLPFHQGVPFPAGGASAHPFGVFIAAVAAEPQRFGLYTRCHSSANLQIFCGKTEWNV